MKLWQPGTEEWVQLSDGGGILQCTLCLTDFVFVFFWSSWGAMIVVCMQLLLLHAFGQDQDAFSKTP